jgi:hypothetical protein
MSAAVNNLNDLSKFREGYTSLLRHYRSQGQKIQAGRANENGHVEQRHYRLKQAIDQTLMLRGSREFLNVTDYEQTLSTGMQLVIVIHSGSIRTGRWICLSRGRIPAKNTN